jgi:subtilase family serine protease
MRVTSHVLTFAIALVILNLSSCGGGSSSQTASAVEDNLIANPLSHNTGPAANPPVQGTGIGGTLSPSDIRTHYNFPFAYTGTGQAIAIVDAPGTANALNDLNTFSRYYGLPQCNLLNNCFQLIDLSNGAKVSSTNNWSDEIALDTQWAHAVAPSAKIVLIQAKSASLGDLFAALSVAVNQPNIVAISISWGTTEFSAETSAAYDGFFRKYPSIAFFAAAGDSGNNNGNQLYPAASPYVTAVGGTTIHVLGMPTSSSNETAWSLTGGGKSNYESMPTIQSSYFSAQNLSTEIANNSNHRAIPDIAYNADPTLSPVAVVINNAWFAIGGTSEGAPQWAAIAANFSQYLKSKNTSFASLLTSKNGFNGILYQTKLEQMNSYSFFDVSMGSNGNSSCVLCSAATGFDDLTGLGVPNVGVLFGHF